LVGDGSFVFGAPLAALWAAQVNAAPFLCVILNNACYNATLRPLVAAYPEGYSVRGGEVLGVNLTPPPRYALLAESVGGYGEQVEDPGELLSALRRGMEQVHQGKTAVIDVLLAHPG
jgi:acetolactate synthase-1/2/3 large subunit